MTEEFHKIDFNPTPISKKETNINSDTPSSGFPLKIILFVVIIGLGIGTGYLINTRTSSTGSTLIGGNKEIQSSVPSSGLKVGDVIGNADEKTFKDKSTGVLEEGGVNGEGSHRLLREGGVSQTVYLTSSVVDLDEFVGHKVTVWGETFAAQRAGWLMDVGRVKVEELNATPPEE
jgi:hypothetical protein